MGSTPCNLRLRPQQLAGLKGLMISQKHFWICSFFCISFRNELRHSTNYHFSPSVRSSGFTKWWARKNIEFALFSVFLSEMSWDIQQIAIHQKQWTSPKTNRTNSKMQWLYLIELLNNWIIDNRFFLKKSLNKTKQKKDSNVQDGGHNYLRVSQKSDWKHKWKKYSKKNLISDRETY